MCALLGAHPSGKGGDSGPHGWSDTQGTGRALESPRRLSVSPELVGLSVLDLFLQTPSRFPGQCFAKPVPAPSWLKGGWEAVAAVGSHAVEAGAALVQEPEIRLFKTPAARLPSCYLPELPGGRLAVMTSFAPKASSKNLGMNLLCLQVALSWFAGKVLADKMASPFLGSLWKG